MAMTNFTNVATRPTVLDDNVYQPVARRTGRRIPRQTHVCQPDNESVTPVSTNPVEDLRLSDHQRASTNSSAGDVVALFLLLVTGAGGVALTGMMAMSFYSMAVRFSALDIMRMIAGMP